jgi:hypothetical protein
MFKDHYISLGEESRKFNSVESWVKYVGSRFFARFVVTLWVRQRREMILTIITPSMNHSWYEPQLVYHEPQLVKFEIRLNHNLEPRRPIKLYRVGSENLNGYTTCV